MTKVPASKEVVNTLVSKLNIINLATHQRFLKKSIALSTKYYSFKVWTTDDRLVTAEAYTKS